MWKMVTEGEKQAVYSVGENGEPFGAPITYTDSTTSAETLIAYLVANEHKNGANDMRKKSRAEMSRPKTVVQESKVGERTRMEITCESLMVRGYPDIPLPDDINLEMIPEAERFFVTLPIGQFNAESLNGRRYLEKSMRQLVEQINTRRPESNWGHIKDEDYGTFYGEPPVRWIAAISDAGGVVWGKARVLTPEAQRYYRNAMIDNARVGTSIFAWAEMDDMQNVVDLELISIDLADPARVGVPITAARAMFSTEMSTSEKLPEGEIENAAPEVEVEAEVEEMTMEKAQETLLRKMFSIPEESDILQEMHSIREAWAQIENLKGSLAAAEGSVSTLTSERDELKTRTEQLSTDNTALTAELQTFKTEREALIVDAMNSAIDAKLRLPAAREMAKYLLKDKKFSTREEMQTALDEVLALEMIKKSLSSELHSENPSQTRPDKTNSSDRAALESQYLEPLPESEE